MKEVFQSCQNRVLSLRTKFGCDASTHYQDMTSDQRWQKTIWNRWFGVVRAGSWVTSQPWLQYVTALQRYGVSPLVELKSLKRMVVSGQNRVLSPLIKFGYDTTKCCWDISLFPVWLHCQIRLAVVAKCYQIQRNVYSFCEAWSEDAVHQILSWLDKSPHNPKWQKFQYSKGWR